MNMETIQFSPGPYFGCLNEKLVVELRWPNTVCARALANAMQRARKDCTTK